MGDQPTVEEGLQSLTEAIAAHPELSKCSPDELQNLYKTATDIVSTRSKAAHNPDGTLSLAHAQKVKNRVVGIDDLVHAKEVLAHPKQEIPVREEYVNELRARARAYDQPGARAEANPVRHASPKNHTATAVIGSESPALMEARIMAGLCFISAAFSLIGLYNAARHAVDNDVDGRSHVQWNQVGIAGLNGLFATGCAYLGGRALQQAALHH